MKPKKICSVDGCKWPLFARGYCSSHYKSLYLNPKLNALDAERKAKGLKTPKAKVRHIKKDVEQFGERLVRLRRQEKSIVLYKKYRVLYKKYRLIFINKKKREHPEGKLFCIFCGKEIIEIPSLHHYDGRDGSNLLDAKKWLLSHNKCHVDGYHSREWRKLSWWYDYLERIKIPYPLLYLKELKKMEK